MGVEKSTLGYFGVAEVVEINQKERAGVPRKETT